jgi:hypothetical protein
MFCITLGNAANVLKNKTAHAEPMQQSLIHQASACTSVIMLFAPELGNPSETQSVRVFNFLSCSELHPRSHAS